MPRADADGKELGGVPVVLRDAPLGTYLGWNITAAGFFKRGLCNYAGSMIPFAKSTAALNHPHLAQICSVGKAPTPNAPAFAGSASFGVGPEELT